MPYMTELLKFYGNELSQRTINSPDNKLDAYKVLLFFSLFFFQKYVLVNNC